MTSKKKINTKIYEKSEVVVIDDKIPQILWTYHFIEAQRITPNKTIVYQFNESAITMEVNIMSSSGKKT